MVIYTLEIVIDSIEYTLFGNSGQLAEHQWYHPWKFLFKCHIDGSLVSSYISMQVAGFSMCFIFTTNSTLNLRCFKNICIHNITINKWSTCASTKKIVNIWQQDFNSVGGHAYEHWAWWIKHYNLHLTKKDLWSWM